MRAFPSAGNPALRDHQPAAPSLLFRRDSRVLGGARPSPVFRFRHQPSPDRIQVNILDRVPVVLNGPQSVIEEASLPQLTSFVAAMKRRGRGQFHRLHYL